MNEMTAPAPAPENTLDVRVKAFNAELIPLLGKYQLGLGASAGLTPDGRVFARPQLFDDSKKEEAPATDTPPVAAESTAPPAAPATPIVEG